MCTELVTSPHKINASSGVESNCLNSKIIYNRYTFIWLECTDWMYIFLRLKAGFDDSVAVLGK